RRSERHFPERFGALLIPGIELEDDAVLGPLAVDGRDELLPEAVRQRLRDGRRREADGRRLVAIDRHVDAGALQLHVVRHVLYFGPLRDGLFELRRPGVELVVAEALDGEVVGAVPLEAADLERRRDVDERAEAGEPAERAAELLRDLLGADRPRL